MFTRVVELTSKSGKAKELANTIHVDSLITVFLDVGCEYSWGRISPELTALAIAP